VRRHLAALSVVVLVAVLAFAVGCVDSSEEAAQTPASAPTVVNSAAQTDSAGKTVTAPAATAPAPAPAGGADEPPAAPAGDATAGMQVFAATCTSCHLNDGNDAGGIGPQLKGAGLTAAVIDDTVTNGRPGTAMVGGLVTGADKENVEAYVLSLQ
jgi:mono/diheme cytochrome c family protein